MRKPITQAVVMAIAASLSNLAAADDAVVRNTAAADSVKLEEVVVTAQKREERLQNVPMSIAVLSGDHLDRSTSEGLRDALNRVSGVAIVMNQNSNPQLVVRGVGPASARFAGTSTAGYYIDTVPFALVRSATIPDLDAYDLERVEVLKGPQGTLYGASALNGVVRVLTKDADLSDFGFKARGLTSATEEGGWNYRGDMAINVPLVKDKLAARVVAGHQELSGWIDRPVKKDANDLESTNVRVKVRAQPTEALSIGLSTWFSRIDNGSQPIGDENSHNPLTMVEPNSDDFDAYGLRVSYALPRFSVTSMTSYLQAEAENLTDFAPFGLPRNALTRVDDELFSEEVVLTSTQAGSWRWSVGGIYRKAEDLTWQSNPSIGPNPVTLVTDTSDSLAVFGELTRVLLGGKFELTGGLRYFEDDVSKTDHLNPQANIDNSFDKVSPRAVFKWLPTEDLTVYASYAEGYRSGVNQILSILELKPSQPDSLKNYELGAKGNLSGGSVGYDVAVYYSDWQDAQAVRTITYQASDGTTRQSGATVNADAASGLGIDVGLRFHPIDRLALGLSANWNDLTLDRDAVSRTTSATTVLARNGERLNNSPKSSFGASADYVFALGGSGLEGQLSASTSYVTEMKAAINSTITSDPIFIGRASFAVDSPNHWTAALFVDNINNEQDILFYPGASAPYYTGRPRPRTIGVQFDYRY